ncbi:MAG: hypothetical protein ACK5UI_03310 [Bacteroidota bacterium]|jgi:hypothetical protein
MGKFIITTILLAASLVLNITISRSAKKSNTIETATAKPQKRVSQTFDIELKELQKNIGSKPVKKTAQFDTPAAPGSLTAD